MKIGIDMGHTLTGANYGAVGILKESEETRKVGKLVIKYLKELGHDIVDCTVDHALTNSESINKRVSNANRQALDLFVSIHFNKSDGAGNGVEVFTYNGKYLIEADRVLKNIEKLGYRNRGIKNGTSPRRLGVINSTKAKSMLIECMFIDNANDVNRYNIDAIAKAIVEGITGQTIGKSIDNSIAKAIVEGIIGQTIERSIDNSITNKDVNQVGNRVKIKHKDKIIEVDGKMIDDKNYVGVREVFEKLGHNVTWDINDKIVVVE